MGQRIIPSFSQKAPPCAGFFVAVRGVCRENEPPFLEEKESIREKVVVAVVAVVAVVEVLLETPAKKSIRNSCKCHR